MKRLRGVLLGGIALVGMAPFAKFWAEQQPAAAPPQADTRPHVVIANPARKTLYRKLRLPGDVLPNQQVAVYARVQGYVEAVPVDRGSPVKAGDVLAKLAVPELVKQLEKEKADLAVCVPGIARDEANLVWREAIWKRLSGVAAKTRDLVNEEALDDAKGRYDTARAEVELARSKEPALKAAVEKTQAMIDFATIRAPFDGVVTERWVDPGDLVQPAATKMLHVMQVDPVRVRIHVPQSDVPTVRPDSRAQVTVDELPGRTFDAPVARLFWALNRNTKTMSVEIDLRNADRSIRPGMYAHVTIDLDVRADALSLPAAALVTEKRKSFVFVVKDGVAKKVPVRIGLDDGIEFEVLEGVKPEDEVIVDGKSSVSDGERVRASKRP
jgi:RND family efflux transporter MFP subunit